MVPAEKVLEGEAIMIQRAHGDNVLLPKMRHGDDCQKWSTSESFVAGSETLPMSVLLGTDVPELGQLLGTPRTKGALLILICRAPLALGIPQAKQKLAEEE